MKSSKKIPLNPAQNCANCHHSRIFGICKKRNAARENQKINSGMWAICWKPIKN